MTLKLWVATSEGEDLDLFVVLRKFDQRGNEVITVNRLEASRGK